MSLRLADVSRLEARGQREFYREGRDGYLRLRNVNGQCVFLLRGRCSVYPWRPEGCVLYPMILYTDGDEIGLHGFCPFRDEFSFSAGDRAWLRRGIAAEDAEVRERLEARRRG
jgi:Fe-S-cluster containining protein